MNTKNAATTIQNAEFQKGFFGLFWIMSCAKDLLSQGLWFWITMAIGVLIASFVSGRTASQ